MMKKLAKKQLAILEIKEKPRRLELTC